MKSDMMMYNAKIQIALENEINRLIRPKVRDNFVFPNFIIDLLLYMKEMDRDKGGNS